MMDREESGKNMSTSFALRRLLSYVPSVVLVLIGIICFMVFLTDAPHDKAYSVLIAVITVTATVCGLTLRLSSCSSDDEDHERLYRQLGQALLACVLDLSAVLVLIYAGDLLSSCFQHPVLRCSVLCPLMIVACTQFLLALKRMHTILRALLESLDEEEYGCVGFAEREHALGRVGESLPWYFVLSAVIVLSLAMKGSFPIRIASLLAEHTASGQSITAPQEASMASNQAEQD